MHWKRWACSPVHWRLGCHVWVMWWLMTMAKWWHCRTVMDFEVCHFTLVTLCKIYVALFFVTVKNRCRWWKERWRRCSHSMHCALSVPTVSSIPRLSNKVIICTTIHLLQMEQTVSHQRLRLLFQLMLTVKSFHTLPLPHSLWCVMVACQNGSPATSTTVLRRSTVYTLLVLSCEMLLYPWSSTVPCFLANQLLFWPID